MTGQIRGTRRRYASIILGLGLVLAAAANAGEVTLRSNRRVKVNVGGRRVIGTFQPDQEIFVDGLDRGTHKVYVKDVATGGFDLVFVDMPAQDGEDIRVNFGTRVDTSPAAYESPSAPGPRVAPPVEQPPTVAEAGVWRGEMSKLFDLHEVSLDTLEAMQGQLDRMKSDLTQAGGGRVAHSGRSLDREVQDVLDTRRLKTYIYMDSEYSENTSPNDKGQFDLHHLYLGATGNIDDSWSGRAELQFEHGYASDRNGTVGRAEVERAFLTRKGSTTTFTVGQMFNPFGFFSATQQELYKDTIQDPLQFDNLYSDTQMGVHWQFLRRGNHLSFGLFNGDGPTPSEIDTNDDKSFVAGWERKDFMNGRVGLFYNRQRDGNQADRREEKWILSTEQSWEDLHLRSEYFLEKGGKVGAVKNNDAFYADLKYDITEKWNTTLRYDWIRRDPQAASGEHTRKLINFGYLFGPTLRFKADFYRDEFGAGAVRGQNGLDLQLAAAIGL